MPWVVDLDGVLRLGSTPIPGAADAVRLIVESGDEVVFATNNAAARIGDQERELTAMGIDATGRVISAAQAGASLLHDGERVLVLGGPGLQEEVRRRDVTVVADPPCDTVISGLDRDLSYEKLRRAVLGIRGGARWILTNPDVTYPTAAGLEPGAGSIGAAITAATGVEPLIGGKPAGAIVEVIRSRLGPDGIVVGDRPDTDGLLAAALGYRFGLVLTGVTTRDDLADADPAWIVAEDLAALVATLLS